VDSTLLGDEALDAIALLREAPERTCLLSDFDGTLAPIVDDPASSVPLPGAMEVLHRLARRFTTVAVVSGRPAAFLAAALGVGSGASRLGAYGLYGAERVGPDGEVVIDPETEEWAASVTAAADELRDVVPPGVVIERKRTAATVHWRSAPEHELVALDLARGAADRHGLELRTGRMSAELVPAHAMDKGAVVHMLASEARAACFLGDDAGDVPAFRALAELSRTAGTKVVRVAVASRESPPALLGEADVVLDGPRAALAFLERLAAEP
jgi:trehalose 6-phosphate phosphatase